MVDDNDDDDDDDEVWCSRWNNLQRKIKYSDETCPSFAFFITNPT
jgi:hypothetical protein